MLKRMTIVSVITEVEFDRFDKTRNGELDVTEPMQSNFV
jgi:hypothetical protein